LDIGTTSPEKVALPSIYYAHEREVFLRDGMLMAHNEFLPGRVTRGMLHRDRRYRPSGTPR